MPALTPSFLTDFETNVSIIQEDEYKRIAANLWWSKFMKVRPSGSAKEIVSWLLSTAMIQSQGKGGNIEFDDIVGKYATFENLEAGAGLKIRRQQFEDLDGNGIDVGTKWAGDIGAYMAYWPQKQLVNLIKNGHSAGYTTYDSKPFFATDHPVNPFNTGAGTFSNLLTGSGTYDISEAVTLDAALVNLAKVVSHIKSYKMPNGEDPRFLRPRFLVVPPKMQMRATQLTSAKFIAQAAASGGGSADVSAAISSFGWDVPVVADELAGFESDTTFFVGCEELSTNQLGAFVYVDREPFHVNYYGDMDNVELGRKRELEWQLHGRNVAGYGHPYLFVKVKATT